MGVFNRNSFLSFVPPLSCRRRLICIIVLFLHLTTVCFAQDEDTTSPSLVTDSPDLFVVNECPEFDCKDNVSLSLGCADGGFYCYCSEITSFQDLVSACMIETHNCSTEIWENVSERDAAECSTASINIPVGICDESYFTAVQNVSCIDTADLPCLCEQKSDEFLAAFSSNVEMSTSYHFSCGTVYQSFLEARFQNSCSYWSDIPSSIPGCTKCQTQALEKASCTQDEGFYCQCAGTQYLSFLTACINTECPDKEDMDIARNDHSAVCAFVTSGVAASVTLPGSKPKSQDSEPTSGNTGESEGEDDDGEDNGPEMTTVIGIVAGSIAGLSVLLVGGYFLFRKRSKRMSKKTDKPPILPSRPPMEQPNANGVYEMWSSQQKPYQDQPNRPPLPYRPTQPSELHGQPPGAPQSGYYELGPSRF